MSDEIKGFDRAIEQMMNEHSVAPPFGMWNRISAELDTEAMPLVNKEVPTPSQASAVTGYIAATLILGASLISAYFFSDNQANIESAIAPQSTKTNSVTSGTQENVAEPVTASKEEFAPVALHKTKKVLAETSAVQPVKKELVPLTIIPVPQQILIIDKTLAQDVMPVESDEYYFPPVDININQLKDNASVESNEKDEERVAEKKTRSFSGSNDKKIKFKKKKSKGFTYGRLNRLKK